METALTEQINTLRAEMIRLVEEGSSLQDNCVLEKSQALDVLLVAYWQQAGCGAGAQG